MPPLWGFGSDGTWRRRNRKGSSNVAQQTPSKTEVARAKTRATFFATENYNIAVWAPAFETGAPVDVRRAGLLAALRSQLPARYAAPASRPLKTPVFFPCAH